MPAAVRCVLLAVNFLLLSSPPFFERWLGGGALPYLVLTVVVTAVNIALVATWDLLQFEPPPAVPVRQIFPAGALAGIATALLSAGEQGWLGQILRYPLDPNRADMLIVIQLGIRRLLQGANPYAMYAVPWPATLPYGPVMWAPMVIPAVLHADLRFATLLGCVFVLSACGFGTFAEAARNQYVAAVAWLLLLVTIGFSPALEHFVSIGHTPAYWPLLGLFAFLVVNEHWYGVAVTAGLLIVARTTMVSMAPVVLIAVWYRDRKKVAAVTMLLLASAALPFLPFAIWNWTTLKYGMYGSYQEVIKGFVWKSTDWVTHTIGLTGPLLARGGGRYAEIVQALLMLAVYAVCARAIRSGRRPVPWMGLALFAFSMTSLWPVIYLYFDVCILFVCAAAAEIPFARIRSPWWTWLTVVGVAALLLGVDAATQLPASPSVNVGTVTARRFLYSGFSGDERDGLVNFAWVDGKRADIMLPRRTRAEAVVQIECRPYLVTDATVQQLSASVNGVLVGTTTLKDGWQTVSFTVPERAWQIGGNQLTLFLSSAVSPLEAGTGPESRRLSLAVDRVTVR